MTDTIIAHIDMDSFFCACEIKRNPKLKGQPLIVGATGNRGVVCTASYEARRYGVFSATPISRARQLCPHGLYLPPDGRFYRAESKRVMNILKQISDDFAQVSIDEAYLDVTTLAQKFDSLERVGKYIQMLIKKKTGLPASIGIAYCRRIAKIASDFNKPFGVTVVEDSAEFLAPLPIQKYPGVGKVSVRRYNARGVYTFGDLIGMDRFTVLEKFGMYGVRIQQIAIGEVRVGITHRDKAKSISRESTFGEDVAESPKVIDKLDRLCHKVHTDLKHRAYKRVSIKLRYSDFSTITRDLTLKTPNASLDMIKQSAFELFEHAMDREQEVRLIGVKLSHLLHDSSRQLTLTTF